MLKLTFVPGNSSYTERFIVINDEKKVAKGLEGGCLAIGCSVQIVRFDIIEKTNGSCIIRSDIAYAVKKEFEANDPKPNNQLLAAAAQIAKRVLES
ncbi:S-norcoclaurine synthase 2-like [Hibiscus syriacus]|uniref:S-norcoclaurine synthase 2-like n=1 Tax=Hibiscus syriacus TaxID=106335 RepID=UPI001924C6CC|nr:S-norcoclaurine synthase 2-like [Hibiscus syriacus]